LDITSLSKIRDIQCYPPSPHLESLGFFFPHLLLPPNFFLVPGPDLRQQIGHCPSLRNTTRLGSFSKWPPMCHPFVKSVISLSRSFGIPLPFSSQFGVPCTPTIQLVTKHCGSLADRFTSVHLLPLFEDWVTAGCLYLCLFPPGRICSLFFFLRGVFSSIYFLIPPLWFG